MLMGSGAVTPSQPAPLLIEIEVGAVTRDVTEGHKRGEVGDRRSEVAEIGPEPEQTARMTYALENALDLVKSSEALVRLGRIEISTRQELVNLRVELVSSGRIRMIL